MTIPKAFLDHKKGTTWDGAEFIVTETDENGVVNPKDLTGVIILAKFKVNNNTVFEFKNSDGTITVPNPTNGKFYFTPRLMNVGANVYIFDVVLTLPDGTIEYIPTHSWTIFK
jgi:hypothetical protein